MKLKNIVYFVVLGMFFNLLLVSNGHAYLDPGTGSALLQGILAALAAIIVVTKLYWHRLLRFFGIRKSKTEVEKNNIVQSKDLKEQQKPSENKYH